MSLLALKVTSTLSTKNKTFPYSLSTKIQPAAAAAAHKCKNIIEKEIHSYLRLTDTFI